MIFNINQRFEYEFNIAHNLLNNLRILCQKRPEQAKLIIPKELFNDIKNGYDIPASAEYYSPITNKFYELDFTKDLQDQLGDVLVKDFNANKIPVIMIEVKGFRTAPDGSLVAVEGRKLPVERQKNEVSRNDKDAYDSKVSRQTEKERKKDSDSMDSKRRKSFVKVRIVVMILIVVLAGAILWFIRDTSVNDCIFYLESNRYQEAVAIYNESINGHSKKEETVNPIVENEINEIEELYTLDSSQYDNVLSNLEVISEISNPNLSDLAKTRATSVINVENSRISYEEGNKYFDDGEFVLAINSYLQVSSDSEYYNDSATQINLSVEKLIDSLSDITESEEADKESERIEKVLELMPDNVALEECWRGLIRISALDRAEKSVADNDYKNVFSIMNDALKKIPGDKIIEEKLTTYITKFKKETFDKAEEFIKSNDYSNVFYVTEEAIKLLPNDKELSEKLDEYHSDYETNITKTVNELVNALKFDQALETLNQALSILNSEQFKTLKKEVEEKKEAVLQAAKEHTASDVEFITYEGNISSENDIDIYTITTKLEGSYRFDVSDMLSGFEVNISVVAPDGTKVSNSSYGLATNEGVTAILEKDKTYTIKVYHYSETGDYLLTIGQQKKAIDITNTELVHDSIEFTDQKNRYDITAAYTGCYRFDFRNVYSGFEANITVFDDHNYKIAHSTYGLANNEGLSVELEAGKTYRVYVYQYSSTSSYDFYIGKQSAMQEIQCGSLVSGEITFTDQRDRYNLVANDSGKYTFTLSGMNSGVECNIRVYDDHDYKIVYSTYGLASGESVTAALEKGKTYLVVVEQYSSSGKYTIKVAK